MIKTTALGNCLGVLGLAVLLGGCASDYKKQAAAAEAMPVNCSTAEGDIRTLNSEKANVAQQIGMGVSAIAPIGLVAGVATGTEGTKAKVASGDYNKMLDQKIAEIKSTCSLN
jgi:hypothetical protein